MATGKVPDSEVAVWKKIAVVGGPKSRAGAVMAFNPSTGKTYVYGGDDTTNYSNRLTDMWSRDGTSWTRIAATTTPSPREDSAMAYDPARKSLIFYGGDDASTGLIKPIDDYHRMVTDGDAHAPAARIGTPWKPRPTVRYYVRFGRSRNQSPRPACRFHLAAPNVGKRSSRSPLSSGPDEVPQSHRRVGNLSVLFASPHRIRGC
jgi:hypothetical protein